jgi:hypothetical protein
MCVWGVGQKKQAEVVVGGQFAANSVNRSPIVSASRVRNQAGLNRAACLLSQRRARTSQLQDRGTRWKPRWRWWLVAGGLWRKEEVG